MKTLRVTCYCCGRRIKPKETVLLTSPARETDRVFVIALECGRKLEDETFVIAATTMVHKKR